MWMIFAILSAVFAALTSILAKSRYRKCKFSPCNGDKDGCGCDYGVGNGLFYPCTGWFVPN